MYMHVRERTQTHTHTHTVSLNLLCASCNLEHELVRKVQLAKKIPKCPYDLALLTERLVTTTVSWEISDTSNRTGGARVRLRL